MRKVNLIKNSINKFVIILTFVIIYCILCLSCKNPVHYTCKLSNYKNIKYVSFILGSIWEGDNLKIIFDNGKYTWESGIYKYSYFSDPKKVKYIIEDYCTLSDSIKITLFINSKDTVFYIPSKQIGLCYIGNDINRKLILEIYERDSTYIIGYD